MSPLTSLWAGRCSVAACLLVTSVAVQAEEIVVGGEDDYRPYETLDEDGQPVGFNVDLMRAVADAAGFEVRFELGEWDNMRDKLDSGRIDVLGMFVSASRARQVDFANPHLIINHRIFIPRGASPVTSLDELEGRDVIVQREAYSHEYLVRNHPGIDLTLVESDTAGLELLARGEHDAALLTEHRGRYTLARRDVDNLAVSGPPVLPVEYAMAVKRGNSDLLAKINVGLDEVMASGRFDQIYSRWLQPPELDEEAMPGTGVVVLYTAGVALLLGLLGWLTWKLFIYRRKMHAARGQLNYLREHDALTGLLSRHALEQRIKELCNQANSPRENSLLDINIDQFRLFNDRLGHTGADEVLQEFAHSLRSLLPKSATIARMGGDEFAVLLTDTNQADALDLGQSIVTTMASETLAKADNRQNLTLSIGLVAFTGEGDSVESVLRRADCACLAAKEDGGNQIHAWHPDDQRLAERYGELGWVSRIQAALGDGRMLLYWQPIVATGDSSQRIAAVEILLRMQPDEADAEPITAGQFMPAAERYFITAQLDRWVVQSVLEWMDNNQKVIERIDQVNINLSGRSLGDARFLRFLERQTSKNAHLLTRLCIEVTETALISNIDAARQILDQLHRKGCCIALDDFGTGVSSMNYLRDLPVDSLKIDGSFMRDIDRDLGAFEFVSEVNRLGHAMHKTTVAEGVETEAILRCLEQVGVDYMQGYFIGYPEPLESLEAHLDSESKPRNSSSS